MHAKEEVKEDKYILVNLIFDFLEPFINSL